MQLVRQVEQERGWKRHGLDHLCDSDYRVRPPRLDAGLKRRRAVKKHRLWVAVGELNHYRRPL